MTTSQNKQTKQNNKTLGDNSLFQLHVTFPYQGNQDRKIRRNLRQKPQKIIT